MLLCALQLARSYQSPLSEGQSLVKCSLKCHFTKNWLVAKDWHQKVLKNVHHLNHFDFIGNGEAFYGILFCVYLGRGSEKAKKLDVH